MAMYRHKLLFGGAILLCKRFLFMWRSFYPMANEINLREQKLNSLAEEFRKEYEALQKEKARQKKLQESLASTGGEYGPVFSGPGWPFNSKMRKPIVGKQGDAYLELAKCLKKGKIEGLGIMEFTTENAAKITAATGAGQSDGNPFIPPFLIGNSGGGNNHNQHNQGKKNKGDPNNQRQ